MTDKETIFDRALEIENELERKVYLDAACGEDQELRLEIDDLLSMLGTSSDERLESPFGSLTRFEEVAATASGFDDHNIPNFELVRRLGEGGFGVVYLAEQQKPVTRKVAIKVVKPGMQSEQVIARFEAERQLLAMMEHKSIARVYDAGTTDKQLPYFVMEFVEGQPITHFADDHKLTTEQRLRLFSDVCEAVQHAHRRGIIHRDIKPSNVMASMQDGQPSVKVIDFGIAKALNEKVTERTLFTAQNQLIGTPQYMSPEQAELSDLQIDTRSDVYSLGVLLYELLTGTTPLTPAQVSEVNLSRLQEMVCEEDAPRASDRVSKLGEKADTIAALRGVDSRELRSTLRGDLDWIVRKSIEKDRDRRYESPVSFAQDIGRHLAGDPVEACPPSWSYITGKFIKRNRAAVATFAMLATFAILGLGLLSRNSVLRQSNNVMKAQRLLYSANETMQADQLYDLDATLALIKESVELAPDQDMARINQTVMSGLGNFMGCQSVVAKTSDHDAFCAAFAFDAQGNHLFAGTQRTGTVLVFDCQNGKRIRTIDLPDETGVRAVHAQSTTESTVVRALCASGNLWEIGGGEQAIVSKKMTLPISPKRAAYFTPDGRELAAVSRSEAVLCDLEASTAKQIELPEYVQDLRDITLSPDQKLLAIGYSPNDPDCGTIIINTVSNEVEEVLHGKGGTYFRCLDFDSNGSRFVFGNGSSTVHAMQDFNQEYVLAPTAPYGAVFRPGFHHLAILYAGGFQYLDSRTRDELYRFPIGFDLDNNATLVFSSTGDKLLAANSKVAHIFDVQTNAEDRLQERLELPGHAGGVSDLRFSPDGKRIASGGGDGKVQLYDAQSGRVLWSLESERGLPVQNLSFSPDSQFIAYSHKEGASPVVIVRTEDMSTVGKVADCGPGQVQGIALVEVKSQLVLVVASGDSWKDTGGKEPDKVPGRLALWDLVSSDGQFAPKQREKTYPGSCRDLKRNDSMVAWINGQHVCLLDLDTNQTEELLDRPVADETLAFTKQNQIAFLGKQTEQFEVWNTKTRKWTRLHSEESLKNSKKADLSFDGLLQSVRVSSRQIEIRKTGISNTSKSTTAPIVRLPPTRTEIWSVAWHPSEYTIAIGDASGAITIWRCAEVNRTMERAGLRPFFPAPKPN